MSTEKKGLQSAVTRPWQLALSRWENEGGAILEHAQPAVVRQRTDERGACNHASRSTVNRSGANA